MDMEQSKNINIAIKIILETPKLVDVLKNVYNDGQEQKLIDKLRKYVMDGDVLSYSEQLTAIENMGKLNVAVAQQKRNEASKDYENKQTII